MIAGLSIFCRFGAAPTSGVSVIPPGTSTFDVTPLPARSAASYRSMMAEPAGRRRQMLATH